MNRTFLPCLKVNINTLPNKLMLGITAFFSMNSVQALVCPSPIIVVNTSCEVDTAIPVTVSTSNAIGMNSSGSLGQIIANGIIENLGAANTTGALAQSGSSIQFNGSTLTTTALTNAAASGQTGLRATGSGSIITATSSSITLGPANGTTTANNLTGARAENGGALSFNNTTINILGGPSGLNNIGVLATGLGSTINITGGSISTSSRASYGVLAQNGGSVTLDGAQIATTGAGSATVDGSHALYAIGASSRIDGLNVNLNVTGNFTNAARAEAAGVLLLTKSTITSAGTSAADTDPASALRALSGGQIQLSDSTVTATGQRGNGFSVQDAGSSVIINNSRISVSGTRAKAGFIFDGGSAIINKSTLLSSNTDAIAVQGAGSTITLTDSSVNSTATLGFGMRLSAGASGTMTNGSATTLGRDSPALMVGNGTFSANYVTFQTLGNDNAIGVLAELGGVINLIGGSVTTSGDAVRTSSFPHAVAARNPGANLISLGTAIKTTGLTAMGAVADDGGTVDLRGNSIETRGEKSIGLFSVTEQVGSQFSANLFAHNVILETLGLNAHGAAAQARNDLAVEKAAITIYDSRITTHGTGAVGLRAVLADYGTLPIGGRGEATVETNGTTVLTEGTGAHGALSRDNPTSVTMNDTSVLATGTLAHGSVAQDGGRIIGNNTTVTARGTLGSALFLLGTPNAVSTGTFTNSVLTNSSGPTIGIAGSGDAVLTDSRAEGSGQWLRVGIATEFPPLAPIEPPQPGIPDPDNPDAPPPSPIASLIAPPITPGLANVTLSGSTVVGSAFTASGSVSNLKMFNESLWTMTGNSNITNLENTQSLIQYTPPSGDGSLLSSYKTLTTQNYLGNNGLIGLNTFLGSDPSPSDILIIDGGTASGSTGLNIQNTTGPGALTIRNGILVVEAINGATTVPGSFYLAVPVLSGPFEYTLHRSSLDNTSEQNWYLRNLCPLNNPRCAIEPPNPNPDVPPSPTSPNYRSEIGLYPVLPAMTLLYGQTLVDTLHQRVGQGKWPEDSVVAEDSSQRIWSRIIGLHGERDRITSRRLIRSSSYDYNFGIIQIGGDLFKREKENGRRDHIGIYGAYGRGTGKVQRPELVLGENQFDALSLGGYWTLYSQREAYIDTVLQATRYYDARSHSYRLAPLKTDGWGYVASIEGGYPFMIKPHWILEPQIQGVYETVNLHDSRDIGAAIQFNNAESTLGRLGVRLAHRRLMDNATKKLTTWIRPNLWYQFKGNPNAAFSSAYGFIPFQSQLEGSTLELNLGTTLDLPKNLSVYANGSYGVGLNMHMTSYDGRIGFKVKLA